ncbi:hypothetical protein F0562_020386 [Nyssa sinensis]|uniref:OCRE domain-containing protein n=1 Tax=Nyssa sinensis TaxID=561372 RepID=A0A5J5BVI8_9ASTE|nr:hypothetical protein F0562_020386 [Nyssa sinensis]
MEEKPTRGHLKRPLPEDDDSNKPPAQKRVRFPKGKKVKPGDEAVDVRGGTEDGPTDWSDPRFASKERAMPRSQITAELFSEENRGMIHDISSAEMHYEDNETFVDDGIQIEPFNLTKEREEGYFDADGNFVEYINDNEIKDAWLDSVDDVDPKLAQRGPMVTNNEEDIQDLSSQEIGKIKRRIADVLEPGETVLQALRRLKGTSNKVKMSAETKLLFDQLTEDAMKLMENGDYNVYEEKQEVFKREAEGYERLAQARGEGTSTRSGQDVAKDLVPNGTDSRGASSVLFDMPVGPSNLNIPTAEVSSNIGDDTFDMFAEDDENATANPTSGGSNLISSPNPDGINQSSASGDMQNDYVYDESSGYYYSSSLGYYYDPSSGLYCCAASGQWYSYNGETGAYDEIQEVASDAS